MLATVQGHRPTINVTVSLSTLTGQRDEPGWLDGYGPISAGYARQLAHDETGTWRRLVTDPVTGQLLDYGTTRYRPPRQLADHVIGRDGECTFPFCTQRARRSDLDHIVAYPRGSTSAGNLHPLHRRHHNAKTEAGWRVQARFGAPAPPDGSARPAGTTAPTHPSAGPAPDRAAARRPAADPQPPPF